MPSYLKRLSQTYVPLRSIQTWTLMPIQQYALFLIVVVTGQGSTALAAPFAALRSLSRASCLGTTAYLAYSDCARIHHANTAFAEMHERFELLGSLEQFQETLFARWAHAQLQSIGDARANRFIVPFPIHTPIPAGSAQWDQNGIPLECIFFDPDLINHATYVLARGGSYPDRPLNRLAVMLEHEAEHLNNNDSRNHYRMTVAQNVLSITCALAAQHARSKPLWTPAGVGLFLCTRFLLQHLKSHHEEFCADDHVTPANIKHAIQDLNYYHKLHLSALTWYRPSYHWTKRAYWNTMAQRLGCWTSITPPFDIAHSHPAPQRRIARLQKRLDQLSYQT